LPGLAFLRADWLPPAEIGVILRKHTTQTATRLFIDMALRTREKSYA
jgi:hypothetical protein